MNPDITTRQDLEALLTDFYSVALIDPDIGHHFANLDLAGHLPVIVDFWEKVLFGRPVYFNNPLLVHQKLNEISPLEREHFDRWFQIFESTVDRHFEGEMAKVAKLRARSIARNLSERINGGIQIQTSR